MVNVWEYIECDNLEFTTKTHNREFIYINKNASDYKYCGDGIAFKNDKMFSAWLQTFRGVIKQGNNDKNSLIVWTYKNKEIHCKTKEEYDNIEGITDTWLCNGIREYKRIYNDKNYKVTTYIPCYDELYEKEFDWKTHSELEYALNNPIEKYNIEKIL